MGADGQVNSEHKSIVRREKDHALIESPMCGMLREIFDAEDADPLSVYTSDDYLQLELGWYY